eukprot:g2048.t1
MQSPRSRQQPQNHHQSQLQSSSSNSQEVLVDLLANDYDVPRDQVSSWTPKAGGATCNVAAGLAKFGAKVSLISAFGVDELGDQLFELLSGKIIIWVLYNYFITLVGLGVNMEGVQRRPEPTRDVYVTRTSQGERQFVGFGQAADAYADCNIDPNKVPIEKIKSSTVVVTGTLGQAYELTSSAIQKTVSIAKKEEICVLIDVNWRPVFFKDPSSVKESITAFVSEADIVKLTDEEAEWMFGIDPQTAMNSPQQVFERLPKSRGVLVTAGEKGASYCFRTKTGIHSGWFPAFEVPAVDTTGAGDAFTSGFIYQLLHLGGLEGLLSTSENVDKAVRFACASGSLTVGAPGAIEGQPSRHEYIIVKLLIKPFDSDTCLICFRMKNSTACFPSRVLALPEPSIAFHRRFHVACSVHGKTERLQRPILRTRPTQLESEILSSSSFVDNLTHSAEKYDDVDRKMDEESTKTEVVLAEKLNSSSDHSKPVRILSRPAMKPRNGSSEDLSLKQFQRSESTFSGEAPNELRTLKNSLPTKLEKRPNLLLTTKGDSLITVSLMSRPQPLLEEISYPLVDREENSKAIVRDEALKEAFENTETKPALKPNALTGKMLTRPIQKPKPVLSSASMQSSEIQNTTRPLRIQGEADKDYRTDINSKNTTPVLEKPKQWSPKTADKPLIENQSSPPELIKKPTKKTESTNKTNISSINWPPQRKKHEQTVEQKQQQNVKKDKFEIKTDSESKLKKHGMIISNLVLIEMRRKARLERQEQRQSQLETAEKELIIEVGAEGMSVSHLAQLLAVDPTEVIKILFLKGIMVTVNQTLDMDSVKVVANEMEVLVTDKVEGDVTDQAKKEDMFLLNDEECISRPPVVTVMGHVDHGKTSLLDYIRKGNVAMSEAGGITQAIGAYTCSVKTENEDRLICFLDTPGHEAFSAMRARGAKVTDIAIIIIAADDGIQPQTKEAIDHAKAADVPLIIAINKMDAPGADPERIKRQLSEIELLPEEWGSKTPVVCISAKTGEGVQDLLEMITLVADIQLDLQANPHTNARGTIVEAHLDKRAGVVCTLLVQNGTLHVGDALVSGGSYGKVKSLSNERGVSVDEASPSIAVQVLGFNLLPSAGDVFQVCESESMARSQAEEEAQVLRQQYLAAASGGGSMVTLSSLASMEDEEQSLGLQKLNIVLKVDTSGSLEAIRNALSKFPQDSVAIRYLHAAAGEVTESDVNLASTADGVIFGFNVLISEQVASMAKQQGVEIHGYSVIYHLLDQVRELMEGKLSPQEDRVWIGRAQVKAVFGTGSQRVAGCRVLNGRLETGVFIQVIRSKEIIYEGMLSSLRRVKDSVNEVNADQECGVGCEEFAEWEEEDFIEAYLLTEKQATLETSQAVKAIDQQELQELIRC